MDEEIKLGDVLFVVKKNWFVILFIFVIIMGIALDYSFSSPKMYKAQSLPPKSRP